MANQLSKKDYEQIKNKSVDVVSFDNKRYRTLTYAGLSYKKAIEHIIKEQKKGIVCMIFEEGVLPLQIPLEHSRDIKDYEQYAKTQAKKDINILWNNAVSLVGGRHNTKENFNTISNYFKEIALKEGYSLQDIDKQIKKDYEYLGGV